MFFFDQPEDLGEFARCLLRSGHQCVASGDSRNLGNPTVRLVPIDDELVVVESHDLIVDRLSPSEPAYSTLRTFGIPTLTHGVGPGYQGRRPNTGGAGLHHRGGTARASAWSL